MATNDGYNQHISQQFNTELDTVKTHMLEMGGRVEQQLNDAVSALISRNSGDAEKVRRQDTEINSMEMSIDDECARILARRQPAASDLRLVIAISKGITDLERIGDEAAKIALQAIELSEQGESPSGGIEIRHIADRVSTMLRNSLDAFARLDTDLAIKVAKEDKLVDKEYGTALRSLVTFMMEDPRSISRVLNEMWALRSLERVGDHARNIAEYVIYLVKGTDVRHLKSSEIEAQIQ